MYNMYCAIGINKNSNYSNYKIEKVVTTDLNVILSFDIIIAFTIIKYTRKIKAHIDYDTYLDYWFKTHDENVIANRSLNNINTQAYTLSELTEIRNLITRIDSYTKDIYIKKRLRTLYTRLFGGVN